MSYHIDIPTTRGMVRVRAITRRGAAFKANRRRRHAGSRYYTAADATKEA